MDAFAVSICKGMSVCKLKPKYVALASGWFGGFQALMPLLGYYLGVSFASFVTNVDHWIAFVLLAIIGGKMIKEASHKEEDCCVVPDFSFKTMLAMAIATSIDVRQPVSATSLWIICYYTALRAWEKPRCRT